MSKPAIPSAASAAWPLEKETTDTDPSQYRRDRSICHLKWVWWTPHFFVSNGKKVNYHDVYVYRGQHADQLPPGLEKRDWTRWVNQKKQVKQVYPSNPAIKVEPKGPPAALAAPSAWVNQMTGVSDTDQSTQGALSTNTPSGTGNGGLPTIGLKAKPQTPVPKVTAPPSADGVQPVATIVASATAPVLPVPPAPHQAVVVTVPAVAPADSGPMDFELTGPPLMVPFQPTGGMAPNPSPPVSQVQIRQDPTEIPEAAEYLRNWVLSTTGGNQRVTHSIVPEEASVLREDWNTVVHHVYWPFGYVCLYFPDVNEAVEFQTDEEMWEDAPRDEGGDVIMGRMCDVPWARCCDFRLAPGEKRWGVYLWCWWSPTSQEAPHNVPFG
ncbi:hypothetical protein EYR41_000694 [Orbilia oligospora]|nr:hypothetical protein TWF751_000859 [Orbilia oligospora]TGJ73607.1 hypothetical protein EYR41_000694 [Orbilia oligospora]